MTLSAPAGRGSVSDWIHSRYTRRLADTAIGGRPARIELQVRRLYCENPLCPKATFAEQIDGLTIRYQRRTPLLQRLVQIAGAQGPGNPASQASTTGPDGISRCRVSRPVTVSNPQATIER